MLYGGTAIPSDADMNDYMTLGNYYCANNATAQTLKNAPFNGSAFILKIEYALGTYRERQIYTRYATNQKAVRYYDGSTWSQYVYFSDDATVSLYQTMTPTNDVLQSAENQPANQAKFYWLGGVGYTGDIPSGGSYSYGTAIALKRGTGSIFVVIFSVGKPIYNSYTSNSWSGWKDYTGTLISS